MLKHTSTFPNILHVHRKEDVVYCCYLHALLSIADYVKLDDKANLSLQLVKTVLKQEFAAVLAPSSSRLCDRFVSTNHREEFEYLRVAES